MMKIMRLALVTKDMEYASAFTEAIAATQSRFAVSVAESVEAPGIAGDSVLVVDKSDAGEAGAGGGAVCREETPAGTGRLRDLAPCAGAGGYAYLEITARHGAEPIVVDKYAGCARICAEAKAAYAMAHGSANLVSADGAGGAACLISFVGVEGGAGASSVALGLAGELSAYRDKKVLYLNFEAFESPRLGTGGRMTDRADMSRFLFAFLGEGKEANATSDPFRSSGSPVSAAPYMARDDYGVMRFPPFPGFNRLRELRGAELGRFMRDVVGETGADMVIADWGGGITDEAAEYLGVSSFVVLVTRHGGAKARGGAGRLPSPPALLYLADELGVDRSKVVAVVGRSPASGVYENSDEDVGADCSASFEDGDLDRRDLGASIRDAMGIAAAPANDAGGHADASAGYVEICEDPYAFDSDGERISISLATSFGTGVKKLADIVLGFRLGADDGAPESDDAMDALFADDGAEVMA
jgi:hypothetical protein